MSFRDVLRVPVLKSIIRFDFERVVGINIAGERTSGMETCRITDDGRGGKRKMAPHTQGSARRIEGEDNCLDDPFSNVGEEGDRF